MPARAHLPLDAHQIEQAGCLFCQAICQPTKCLLLRFLVIAERPWAGETMLAKSAAGLLEQKTNKNPMPPMPYVVFEIKTCPNHALRWSNSDKAAERFPCRSEKGPK